MLREIIFEIKVCAKKVLSLIKGKDKEFRTLAAQPRYTPGTYPLNGARFEFPDSASFVFTYRELFHENIYKFKTNNSTPYILDCGANIGLSVLYCKKAYPGAEVIAFEPERTIFSYLKKNVESMGLTNVRLENKAVWSRNEVLHFNNEGADASRIAALQDGDEGFSSTYEVQAVKLSDYINKEVDFLKIDIEGAEVEVIKEIEPKLKMVKHIFIEYHSFEKSTQELDQILAILTRNGFHYYIDSPNRMKQTPFVNNTSFLSFDFFLNVYAIRQD